MQAITGGQKLWRGFRHATDSNGGPPSRFLGLRREQAGKVYRRRASYPAAEGELGLQPLKELSAL